MRTVLAALVCLSLLSTADAATRSWALISGAVVQDEVTIGAATSDRAVPPGSGWVEIPGTSPLPQPGWAAIQANGAWMFSPPAPAPAQAFSAALASGIAITSASTPSLNATYRMDDSFRANLVAVQTSINANQGLPSGGSTETIVDLAGMPHSLNAAQITALGVAEARCYANLLDQELQATAGQSATWGQCTGTVP